MLREATELDLYLTVEWLGTGLRGQQDQHAARRCDFYRRTGLQRGGGHGHREELRPPHLRHRQEGPPRLCVDTGLLWLLQSKSHNVHIDLPARFEKSTGAPAGVPMWLTTSCFIVDIMQFLMHMLLMLLCICVVIFLWHMMVITLDFFHETTPNQVPFPPPFV